MSTHGAAANRAPCPNCRGLVEATPTRRGEFSCRVCGSPVVVGAGPGITRSGGEIDLLRSVRRERRHSYLFRAMSVVLGAAGAAGALFVGLLLLFVSSGFWLTASTLGLVGVPWLLMLLAWRKANGLERLARAKYAEAELLVAEEVVRSLPNPTSVGELSRILATTEAHTDELVARLNTQDSIESSVTEDGEVVLYPRSAGRLRVDTAGPADLELENLDLETASLERGRSSRPGAKHE